MIFFLFLQFISDRSFLYSIEVSDPVSDYLYAAKGTDQQNVAGTFAEQIIHGFSIDFHGVIFHECLDRSGETSAVDPTGTGVLRSS